MNSEIRHLKNNIEHMKNNSGSFVEKALGSFATVLCAPAMLLAEAVRGVVSLFK